VYEIDTADRPALDRAEGFGDGYAEKCVEVITDSGALGANARTALLARTLL
jgi:hypothetical protein